jgi:hypothetical protein
MQVKLKFETCSGEEGRARAGGRRGAGAIR